MCLAFVVFWWGPKRLLSPAACPHSLQLDIDWVSCRSWTLCRLLIDVAAFSGVPPSTYLPFPYLGNPCSSFCMCPLMASFGKSSQACLGVPLLCVNILTGLSHRISPTLCCPCWLSLSASLDRVSASETVFPCCSLKLSRGLKSLGRFSIGICWIAKWEGPLSQTPCHFLLGYQQESQYGQYLTPHLPLTRVQRAPFPSSAADSFILLVAQTSTL